MKSTLALLLLASPSTVVAYCSCHPDVPTCIYNEVTGKNDCVPDSPEYKQYMTQYPNVIPAEGMCKNGPGGQPGCCCCCEADVGCEPGGPGDSDQNIDCTKCGEEGCGSSCDNLCIDTSHGVYSPCKRISTTYPPFPIDVWTCTKDQRGSKHGLTDADWEKGQYDWGPNTNPEPSAIIENNPKNKTSAQASARLHDTSVPLGLCFNKLVSTDRTGLWQCPTGPYSASCSQCGCVGKYQWNLRCQCLNLVGHHLEAVLNQACNINGLYACKPGSVSNQDGTLVCQRKAPPPGNKTRTKTREKGS